MHEKILVVSEMNAPYDHVLQSLGCLKQLGAKTCFLYLCLEKIEVHASIMPLLLDTYDSYLKRQKQILTDAGFAVEIIETDGNLTREALFELAQKKGCSLVVAGSPRHTRLGNLLFGGVTSMILYHATLPLLIIRTLTGPAPEEKVLTWESLTGHVLFPTDFSANARQAFDYVKQFVAAGALRVTILHIQDKAKLDPHLMDRLDAFNKTDQARLDQLSAELKALGPVDVQTSLIFGSPTSEILRVIREQEVSLVIMGSQGRGYIEELRLGSVSHNIARLSDASVLLIPFNRPAD